MYAKLGIVLGCLAGTVNAHSLFMQCHERAQDIYCQAGFSDGSSARDLPFEVISYEDQLLMSGQASDSGFSFSRPQTEFYILLDAGPGHVVELDMQEISEE